MSVIGKTLKFIVNDFKTDAIAIKKMVKAKPIKDEEITKWFTTGWEGFLKENWIMFLLLLLALSSGAYIGGKYYDGKCNDHILKTFYPGVYYSGPKDWNTDNETGYITTPENYTGGPVGG